MTAQQFEALLMLIEAIVERDIADYNDEPPNVMAERRRLAIDTASYARKLFTGDEAP